MIWEGVYSEAIHFGCAFVLAWVGLRLISVMGYHYSPKDKLTGALGMMLIFGLGSLLHLVLDTFQGYF